jgi:peptidoglycan/LPS O-acetylase OafA/YrhL
MAAGETVTSPPTAERLPRVAIVDGLRGIASLAVCWYHLVFADHAFVGGGLVAAILRNSARNTWTGVEVFFVISGFVIPLALFRSRYTPRAYGPFILKRIVRLDPPYLVSVVLCVALWYLWAIVPRLHGPAFTLTVSGLLLHLGYLNAFFHQGWLNPVYWTLAIEFQYYLGMGLIFGVLASRHAAIRYAGFALLGALAFLVPSPTLVFHYLFVFMLGMTTFQYFAGLLSLRGYLMTMAIFTIGCTLTLGPMVAGVSLLTALVIAFVRRDFRALSLLGAISYSLYLIHVPVGGRILDLGLSHVHGGVARVLVLAVTLVLTIGVATLFYRFIERPAQRWSSAIRYRRNAGPDHGRVKRGGAVVTGIAEP